jgi:predicted proteasome-type protease
MIKCKYTTYINGVIGAKCRKVTLIFVNGNWIDATTGEFYVAVIDARNGKIKGFMRNIGAHLVYSIKRRLFYD